MTLPCMTHPSRERGPRRRWRRTARAKATHPQVRDALDAELGIDHALTTGTRHTIRLPAPRQHPASTRTRQSKEGGERGVTSSSGQAYHMALDVLSNTE